MGSLYFNRYWYGPKIISQFIDGAMNDCKFFFNFILKGFQCVVVNISFKKYLRSFSYIFTWCKTNSLFNYSIYLDTVIKLFNSQKDGKFLINLII